MSTLNQAVILCGGLGTRLRPHTDSLPKPMILCNGKPFLEYLLEQLAEEGGLLDSCESVGCEETDHIDRVFFKNGEKIAIDAISWRNFSSDFLDSNGVDLSDHPPISATLAWSAVE